MSVVLPIQVDTRYRIITASAGQTVLAIPFPWQDNNDVSLFKQVNGAWVALTNPAGYTLTGAGQPAGGNATLTTPAVAGEQYLALGSAVLDRLSSIVQEGRFRSKKTDDELDRNRIIQQEQARDLGRAVKVGFGQAAQDMPAPDGISLLGWSTDNKLVNRPGEGASAALAEAARIAAEAAAATLTYSDQPTAEAGAATNRIMSPLRTKQQIDTRIPDAATAQGGTDNAKFLTPARAVDFVKGWADKLFGTDSVPRTVWSRVGDVVDLDDFGLDGSGVLGTAAANDAAIAKLVAYMNGAGAGKAFRSRKGRQYAFTTAFTVPSTVRMRLDGALFRYFGNTITSSDLIHFNGCDFDTLRLHLPDTYFRVRPIKVTGCRGDFIECISDTPIDNWNASNIDWAVRLYGRNSLEQENRIGEIYIENFNKALGIIGDSFSKTDPQKGGYVGYVRLKNFEKGVNVRNVDGMSLRGGLVQGRTSGITNGQPGQNGILISSAKNMHIHSYTIEDAPEHGFRGAGDDTLAEVDSYNNHIHDLTIKRAIQCGFKIWTGSMSALWKGGTIHDITVEDAIWGNPNTTGFNYSAFLLQNFHNCNMSNLQASAVDQAFSGREAFFIGAGGRSTLSNLRSYLGGRVNAVRFSEFNNGETDTVNNLAAQNQVKIEGLYSEGHTGDGVYIDSPTQSLRDIVVTDAYFVGGVNAFNASAAAARFVQPCIFEAGIRGHSGALSALPASANITTINKRTSVA